VTRQEFVTTWLNSNKRKGVCFYCGRGFGTGKKSKTQEHILPKSQFPNFPFNVVSACKGCNLTKNGYSLNIWRDMFIEREKRSTFYCEEVVGHALPHDFSKDGNGGNTPVKISIPVVEVKTDLLTKLLDVNQHYYNRMLLTIRKGPNWQKFGTEAAV
jgi:hypothetical protein